MRKAVILAAGRGTRLAPLTDHCPKPMLPVGGRPLLEHVVALLARHGVTELCINLHHLPRVVMDHFGDGSAFGVRIRYSVEEDLLGTGGALNAFRDVLDETFLVYYGDVLTTLDLSAMLAFHRAHGGLGTLALYRVPDPSRCGIVDTDAEGRVTGFVEKPAPGATTSDLANAGLYILEPGVFDLLPRTSYSDFGYDVFPALLAAGKTLYGYPTNDYLVDIGLPANYNRARQDMDNGPRLQ